MTTHETLSIIFPCYQETPATIARAIKKINSVSWLKSYKKDYIISVNGEINTDNYKQYKDAQIILDKRKGIGVGIRNGLIHASGKYCYIISPDLSFDLSDLQAMERYSHYDLLIGSKLHPQSTYQIKLIRKITSYGIHWLTKILFPKFNVRDPHGSVFGKTKLIQKIAAHTQSDDFFFHTELIYQARKVHANLIEVPVTYIKNDPKSSVKISDGLNYIKRLLSYRLKTANKRVLASISLSLLLLTYYVWPLFSYQTNMVGSGGDIYSHVWFIDWFCQNYFKLNFTTDALFAPFGVNFAKGYDMPTIATLSCPFIKLSPIAAINATAIIQLGLILISSWLVALRYLKNHALRLSFIVLYLFSPFNLSRLQGHLNILGTSWAVAFTFVLLDEIKLYKSRSVWKRLALLGLILVSTWQNFANLFLISAILIAKNFFAQRKTWKLNTLNIIIGGIIMITTTLPFSLPMIIANLGGVLPTKTTQLISFNNLSSFIVPWKNHLFFNLVPESIIHANRYIIDETAMQIDPIILIIILFSLILFALRNRKPKNARLLLIGTLYAIITFGQMITIKDKSFFIGFFEELYNYLPLSLTRVPSRLGIVTVFTCLLYSMTYLDNYLASKTSSYRRRISTTVLIYALITTTLLARNLQINTIPYTKQFPLESLQSIAADKTDDLVLNIPLDHDQTQNFMQLFHHKKLVTGYIAYTMIDSFTHKATSTSPLMRQLNCREGNNLLPIDPWIKHNSFEPIVTKSLKNQHIKYLIINKDELSALEDCQNYKTWLYNILPTYPNLSNIGENDHYVIYQQDKPSIEKTSSKPIYFVAFSSEAFKAVDDTLQFTNQHGTINIISINQTSLTYTIDIEASPYQQIQINDRVSQQTYDLTKSLTHSSTLEIRPGNNYIDLHVTCNKNQTCTSPIISNVTIQE